MNQSNILGRRIQYRKGGSRNGWTGTIKEVTYDRSMPGNFSIDVQYDNGVNQRYCIEALEGHGIPVRFPEAAGYLHFLTEPVKPVEIWNFIIINERTGEVDGSADLHDDARDIASSMVRETKDKYRIYKSYAVAYVEQPPVAFTVL